MSKGEHAKGMEIFKEAIGIDPDNNAAYNNLGLALAAQGKVEEAIAAHREAIRLKPDLAESHYNLGTIYRSTGKSTRAPPSSARRSGSSPISPKPTATLAPT